MYNCFWTLALYITFYCSDWSPIWNLASFASIRPFHWIIGQIDSIWGSKLAQLEFFAIKFCTVYLARKHCHSFHREHTSEANNIGNGFNPINVTRKLYKKLFICWAGSAISMSKFHCFFLIWSMLINLI